MNDRKAEAQNKMIVAVIAVVLFLVIGTTLTFYFLIGKMSSNVGETFTAAQVGQLKLSAGEYSNSGGRLANGLINFFETTDLETSQIVCKQELVMEQTNCYRLLAISKPENKETICQNVQDSEQRETCEMGIPFLM